MLLTPNLDRSSFYQITDTQSTAKTAIILLHLSGNRSQYKNSSKQSVVLIMIVYNGANFIITVFMFIIYVCVFVCVCRDPWRL